MANTKKIITKAEAGIAIAEMQDFSRPDLLKIPKKNTQLHYRWIRNTPDNLLEWNARGYNVLNSDQVRECGFEPSTNGACVRGDLILAATSWKQYTEFKEKKEALALRQQEMQKQGTKRVLRAGNYAGHEGSFEETIKEG